MSGRVTQWFKDANPADLLIVALWAAIAILNATHGDPRTVVAAVAACWAFIQVAALKVELRRAERVPPNSVLLSSPTEPSSDARQAARMLTDYRNALIGQGMSPHEATEFMASWASKAGGGS